MGIHQFKLSMVPQAYFDRIGSPVPSMLTKEDIDRGERADTGWWASLQPTPQALTRLREICPNDKSWGETEEYVTSEIWGSDLRIWREKGRVWLLTFRFSPTADDRALLDRFVDIARDEHCLLLDSDTGSLFEPETEVVTEHLSRSTAMRFLRDPQSAISEAARAARETDDRD
jgi:hypothetical protein